MYGLYNIPRRASDKVNNISKLLKIHWQGPFNNDVHMWRGMGVLKYGWKDMASRIFDVLKKKNQKSANLLAKNCETLRCHFLSTYLLRSYIVQWLLVLLFIFVYNLDKFRRHCALLHGALILNSCHSHSRHNGRKWQKVCGRHCWIAPYFKRPSRPLMEFFRYFWFQHVLRRLIWIWIWNFQKKMTITAFQIGSNRAMDQFTSKKSFNRIRRG